MVTSYQFQWRYSGDAWSGKLFNQDSSCYTVEIADTSTSVQARVRARNSVRVRVLGHNSDGCGFEPVGAVAAASLVHLLADLLVALRGYPAGDNGAEWGYIWCTNPYS